MTKVERYEQMLAGRGLKIGDQVICTYRSPSPNQWWVAPWHVGVIEPIAEDNRHANYFVTCHYVMVRYLGSSKKEGFTQLDQLGSLRALEFGIESESPYFPDGGEGAMKLWQFACRCGLGDLYREAALRALVAARK